MGFMKHAVVLTSIIILAYLIHRPILHDVPERGKVKLLKDVISFLELLGSISNKVGYSRWWSIRLEPGLVPTPNGTKVEHQHFEGVDCLIVTPKSFQKRTEPGPAIVYYHGGGWVTGSISMYKSLLIDLAEETGFLVMSPEYRKAPEHPFPTPYYDCLISTISFMTLSQQLNVHPNKIVLAGDGAGGNLAMAVYLGLLQMDSSTIQLPAMQVVIYPMLQMINFQTPSYSHSKDYLFPNNMIQKFWLAYIGLDHRHDLAEIIARNGHFDKSDKNFSEKWKMVSHDNIPDKYKQQREYVSMDDTKYELPYEVRDHVKSMMLDTRIAPLLASDDIVKRIKKTLVLVCEYDPLRDDGILLYQRIKSLKGKVELQYLPTSLHGATTLGAALKNSYYSEQNNILFRAIRDGIEEESVLEEESVMFNNFFFFP